MKELASSTTLSVDSSLSLCLFATVSNSWSARRNSGDRERLCSSRRRCQGRQERQVPSWILPRPLSPNLDLGNTAAIDCGVPKTLTILVTIPLYIRFRPNKLGFRGDPESCAIEGFVPKILEHATLWYLWERHWQLCCLLGLADKSRMTQDWIFALEVFVSSQKAGENCVFKNWMVGVNSVKLYCTTYYVRVPQRLPRFPSLQFSQIAASKRQASQEQIPKCKFCKGHGLQGPGHKGPRSCKRFLLRKMCPMALS